MTEPFETIGQPWWDDRPVWIVGGGPSLSGYDLSGLRSSGRVLGVNRAADLVPCTATFTLDHNFLKKRTTDLTEWAQDGQEVFAAVADGWFDARDPIPGVTYLRRIEGKGVGRDLTTIINGKNSGYGALCLAILKRAREIYLLGYDFRHNAHWHGGYPWGSGRCQIYFERWAKRFDEIAEDLPNGVVVWNGNVDSVVQAFPFKSYEDLGLSRLLISEKVV